jgi:hypothetical protein
MSEHYLDLGGQRLEVPRLCLLVSMALGVLALWPFSTSVWFATLGSGFLTGALRHVWRSHRERKSSSSVAIWAEALSEAFFGPDRTAEFFGDLPSRVSRWRARYGEERTRWVVRIQFAGYVAKESSRKIGAAIDWAFSVTNWLLDQLNETGKRILEFKHVVVAFLVCSAVYQLRMQLADVARELLVRSIGFVRN